MGTPQTKTRITSAEYLEIERAASEKSGFFRGEMYAMPGASRRHNILAGNTFRLLGSYLLKDKECRPYIADMRLHIKAHEHYTYPDVLVVCGEHSYDDEDNANDATVIVEVLSPSTESYDRRRKFMHYRSLPSFQEYVLINQDEMLVEVFHRGEGDDWLFQALSEPSARLHLHSLNFSCTLADIYGSISFEEDV